MKLALMTTGVLALTLVGSGCATKKYVRQTITPVDARLSSVESKNDAKNTDQDTKIAANDKEIADVGTDLSRTKERVNDVDQKAIAAGNAAKQADTKADNAQKGADAARGLAQQGLERTDKITKDVEKTIQTIDGVNRYQMLKSETVLFNLSQSKLTAESKAQLDDLAKLATGQERYMIEVQGFTDKTGSPEFNQQLSNARAAEVTRYMVNEHKIPVRSISQVGSGYALPVADDKTRDGRAMNRRVEVRLFVPEIGSASKAFTASR